MSLLAEIRSSTSKQEDDAAIGKILGPSFARDDMPQVIEKIINVYVDHRTEEEEFLLIL